MAAPKPKGKRITAQVKLQIMAGKATPAPPVGPALGQHGANIMEFCKQFNAKTSGKDQAGLIIPAVVTIYQDRSFTFITKTPPAPELIRKAAGMGRGMKIDDPDSYEKVNAFCDLLVVGGGASGLSAALTAAVVGAVRANTELPVLAKLAPNVPDVTEIARAAVDAGADALTIANTVPAMRIDVESRRPVLGGVTGGLSGHGLRPVSMALVYRAAQVVDVPIIGVGGIFNAEHVLEYLMAGATAVQVGSANLADPWAPFRILDELVAYLGERGISDLREIIGAAQV